MSSSVHYNATGNSYVPRFILINGSNEEIHPLNAEYMMKRGHYLYDDHRRPIELRSFNPGEVNLVTSRDPQHPIWQPVPVDMSLLETGNPYYTSSHTLSPLPLLTTPRQKKSRRGRRRAKKLYAAGLQEPAEPSCFVDYCNLVREARGLEFLTHDETGMNHHASPASGVQFRHHQHAMLPVAPFGHSFAVESHAWNDRPGGLSGTERPGPRSPPVTLLYQPIPDDSAPSIVVDAAHVNERHSHRRTSKIGRSLNDDGHGATRFAGSSRSPNPLLANLDHLTDRRLAMRPSDERLSVRDVRDVTPNDSVAES